MDTRFATHPNRRRYIEGYGFLSFARNLASSQAAKKAKQIAINQGKDAAIKAGKRALNKGAEATGDLVGQKVADSIAKIGTKPAKVSKSAKKAKIPEFPTPPVPEVKSVDNMITEVKKMSPQKRAQIINELSLL